MGHLSAWAAKEPERTAVVMGGSGTRVTYRQLDEGSNRLARLLRRQGLGPGATYAVLSENHPRYLEACAAGERAGLFWVPVNSHLTAPEVAYILRDSGARVLVTTAACLEVAAAAVAQAPRVERALVLDPDGVPPVGALPDRFERYDTALEGLSPEPLDDEGLGSAMFYSSGTTGQPKGVRRPLTGAPADLDTPYERMFRHLYGCSEADVYLSPAPLYHTAPLAFCQVMHRLGATVVVMERFDPEDALRLVEAHRVTFAQWVPTMFVRMLKLPEDRRRRFDVSSLRITVHAAAPCPVEVKRRMIDWWGPIICEYYGGTEANGITFITAQEWLGHPGSVGRAILGTVEILDDDGNALPVGEVGTIYFAGGPEFAYHNDPAKTRAAGVGTGRTTIGDIGYVDGDGYLYLTDRKAYTIISGGVNVYPQEVEDALILHPSVADVAVFGVPDPDMGEQVKAVVQPAPGVSPSDELERELIEYCRGRLARFKCPRSVDFCDELPRLDTGKLYKRKLKEAYWR